MRWDPRRHLPIAAGISLIVAAIGLVAPWWAIQAGSNAGAFETTVAPFDPGPAENVVNEGAVVAVGVLAFVGIVGLVGGLVLRLQADDRDTSTMAGWLWMASGGFLLVAPLAAVPTWPADDLSFWGSAGVGGATFSAGADWGWYVTLTAGAIAAVAGMAWLLLQDRMAHEQV